MSAAASGLMSDLTYALRQIRKNLRLTLLSVSVLAIGIGATTAVFAVLYQVLLKPLPYRDAGHIVFVHNEFPSSQLGHTAASAPDYADLSAHHEIFSETAAYYFNDFTITGVSGSGYAEHVDAVNASATLFPMLGMRPELGRTVLADDDRYGAPKVAVLSDSLWKSKFGGDPKAIGRTIQLDEIPYQIIGVMPADFNFPYPATQMWVPLALPPAEHAPGARGSKWLRMLARIASGATLDRANAMLGSVSHTLAVQYAEDYPERAGWHFSIQPILAEQTKDVRQWLLLAFGAVICVLLIACTNVSGLLLVRATVRSREWAVRSALGASTGRLIRQILTETAVLVVIGCSAGLGLSFALVRLINTYGPIHRTQMEPWALVFVVALCVVSTAASGLLPAALSSNVPIEQMLKAGTGRTVTGQTRWRGALVAGQIAVAITLLFTGVMLSRSFIKLLAVSPGFSADGVWTASAGLPQKSYTTSAARASFFRSLIGRIKALPGVESASACISLPFSSGGYTADIYFPGRPESTTRPAARMDDVLPDYFDTLKIPLLKGRTFTAHDDANSSSVVVVDQQFVRAYFPSEDPIGKLVANNCCHDQPATIIGVVGDVAARDLGAPPRPEMYWPELQHGNSAMFLVVREAGRTDVTSAVREILHQQDPSVALFDIETMPQRIMDSVKLRRFVAWLLNSFALIGVILAALGLYGTLSYLVQLRRREFAIRTAFGATPRDVAALVARHSAALVLAGLVLGANLCALAARATAGFLFGVASLDPWTIACTAIGLVVLVAVATGPPIARATGIDALETLREE